MTDPEETSAATPPVVEPTETAPVNGAETATTETSAEAKAEEPKRYICHHAHGIKYRGKRVRNHQVFEAFPSEMEGFGHLRNGYVEEYVEEVQTSANDNGTGATGHSEDQEA